MAQQPAPQKPSRSFALGNGPTTVRPQDWVGAPAHWWLMA